MNTCEQRTRRDVGLYGLVLTAMLLAGFLASRLQAREPYPKINLSVGYEVDPTWPQKPDEFQWRYMCSIAVDRRDRVWTLNRTRPHVQVYTADGKFLDAWGAEELHYPHHIHIDHEGDVWIADIYMHVVRKFTPEGELLMTLGTPNETGNDETHFNQPAGTVTTPAGDVFVADGYGNDRIVHFDAKGRFIKSWGELGVKAGQLSLPHSIGIDSKGRIYVGERNNARIQIFDQSGRSLGQWRHVTNPWGIWITPNDEIIVCGSSPVRWGGGTNLGAPPKDQMVIKFNTDGRVLELWTFPLPHTDEPQPGEIDWIHGIAADSKGNLYLGGVADEGKSHRAQKFIRQPSEDK